MSNLKKIKPEDVNGNYESFILDYVLKLVKLRKKRKRDVKEKD